jgi:hypothetical protein
LLCFVFFVFLLSLCIVLYCIPHIHIHISTYPSYPSYIPYISRSRSRSRSKSGDSFTKRANKQTSCVMLDQRR